MDILEGILGLMAILVGAALMYFGFEQTNIIYIFFYFLFGSGLFAMGGWILRYGLVPGKKDRLESEYEPPDIQEAAKRAENPPEEEDEPRDETFCIHCGAPITSAGKFCGSCGALLNQE
jgi:hypothetical protein